MPQGPTVRNDERTRRWPVGLGSKRAGHCLARNERWRCPAASWIDQRVAVRETWPVSPGRARAAGGQARALPHQYSTDGWRSRLEPGRSADGCGEPPLTLWPRAHQACANGSGPCLICASFIYVKARQMKSKYWQVGAGALFIILAMATVCGTAAAPASATPQPRQSDLGRQLNAGDAIRPDMTGGQQQNANLYSFWDFQGSSVGYWNVDQQMKVLQRARSTYWAMLWNWTGASIGGYVGLQTNGQRFGGSTGDTAIFSLWDATAASGPHCGVFGGEGNGYSCRLAYPISKNTYYRYRLWRLNADSGG